MAQQVGPRTEQYTDFRARSVPPVIAKYHILIPSSENNRVYVAHRQTYLNKYSLSFELAIDIATTSTMSIVLAPHVEGGGTLAQRPSSGSSITLSVYQTIRRDQTKCSEGDQQRASPARTSSLNLLRHVRLPRYNLSDPASPRLRRQAFLHQPFHHHRAQRVHQKCEPNQSPANSPSLWSQSTLHLPEERLSVAPHHQG